MELNIIQKPCDLEKIETSQGFSLSYKGHLLYSKYNPKKNIISAVENLQLLPGTIILCYSPLLGYGLKELFDKLADNCLLVLCEAEKALFDFSKSEGIFDFDNGRLIVCEPATLNDLPLRLYELAESGLYKRVIRLDMSAGTQFHKEFYDRLYSACSDSIMTFWKNRITLTRFGRRYSKNLFENLQYLASSKPIKNFFSAIEKPIIVFGAGQSTETLLKSNKLSSKDFYILCADTALKPLLKHGIKPDGVFVEEAQSVIIKAFTGTAKGIRIFAGLSSIPNLAHIAGPENLSYFFTEYTQALFIKDLKEKAFMPPANMPFGSVGLTAVYYALQFRKNDSVPVYICGLDFSYSAGLTHTKGALAHLLRLSANNRLIPVQNYSAAFSTGASPVIDKNGKAFISTPTLKGYAALFKSLFSDVKNLFDVGESGIELGLPKAGPEDGNKKEKNIIEEVFDPEVKSTIQAYLDNEKDKLEYLKKLLTGQTELKDASLLEEIRKIAEPREYLYLHFPDGYRFSTSQSFLNRIRTELDFFLKLLPTDHHSL